MVDQIKIVLTGSCGTGKTSIISRLIFDSFSEDYVSTDGGACGQYTFTYEEFDNKQLIMDIWDTAGQEKYRALTRIFYKDSAVAILVYDITNKKTFEELKTYWNPQLKQVGNEEIILGIAANKSDLFANEEVSEQDGRKFAEEIGATYQATSAFLNNGINELFRELGLRYLKMKYPDQQTTNVKADNNKKDSVQLDKGKTKKKDGFC